MNPKFKELLMNKAKKGQFVNEKSKKLEEKMLDLFDEGMASNLGSKMKSKVTVMAKDPASLKEGLKQAQKMTDLNELEKVPESELPKEESEMEVSEDGESAEAKIGKPMEAEVELGDETFDGSELSEMEVATPKKDLPLDPAEIAKECEGMDQGEIVAKISELESKLEYLKTLV